MFELLIPTAATISSLTNRSELHGDEKVPALSLGLTIETANTILDKLSDTLRHAIYKRADGQEPLPGIEDATPLLRTSCMEQISVAGKFEGWTLHVDHGIDESEPITFGSCKVDKFRVKPKNGGTVELLLRVGTSDVDAESLGLIGMQLGQEISITLLAPKVAAATAQKTTDGGGALFDQDDDKPLNTAGDGEKPERAPNWPFPKEAGAEAPPQSATVEPQGKGKRAKSTTMRKLIRTDL